MLSNMEMAHHMLYIRNVAQESEHDPLVAHAGGRVLATRLPMQFKVHLFIQYNDHNPGVVSVGINSVG